MYSSSIDYMGTVHDNDYLPSPSFFASAISSFVGKGFFSTVCTFFSLDLSNLVTSSTSGLSPIVLGCGRHWRLVKKRLQRSAVFCKISAGAGGRTDKDDHRASSGRLVWGTKDRCHSCVS